MLLSLLGAKSIRPITMTLSLVTVPAQVLIVSLFLGLFFLRLIRWLAIVQQKEYRWDRIWQFVQSLEGKQELRRWLPFTLDSFSMASIKRPKPSGRMIVLATLSSLLATLLLLSLTWFGWVAMYFLVPVLVWLITIPTILAKELITTLLLYLAWRKINSQKPLIIGITGSYAKTSTKLLLAHILSQKYSVFTTPKSYNTRYSIAKSILQLYKQQPIVLLEYAAYTTGEIKELVWFFPPDHSLITGITPQHLGLFGSLEAIQAAKSELIKATNPTGTVFFNGKDKRVRKMLKFDTHPQCEVTKLYLDPKLSAQGLLKIRWQGKFIHSRLVGEHYLLSVQLTIAIAQHLGLKNKQIKQGLETFLPNHNFVQTFTTKQGVLVIDDGKTANPEGFAAIIQLAKVVRKSKKVLLTSGIVDLGNQSHIIHTQLAQQARMVFDTILYVGIEGRAAFTDIAKTHVCIHTQDILTHLRRLDSHCLLVIEGFIPKHLQEVCYA